MNGFQIKRAAIAGIAAAAVCVSMLPSIAMAKSRDDLANEQSASQQALRDLQTDLSEVSADLRSAYTTLSDTQKKIPQAEADLATAESELSAAQREAQTKAALLESAEKELASIEDSISTTEKKTDETNESLGELARSTYRGEALPSTVDLILSTSSASDFLNAYQANEALSRTQAAALTQYEQEAGKARNKEARQKAVQKRVVELKKEADDLVAEQKKKQQVAQQKRDELTQLKETISQKTSYLESHKGEVQEKIDAEKATYEKIAAEIAKVDAANRAAAAAAAQKAQSAQSAPAPSNAGNTPSGNGIIHSPLRIPLVLTSSYGGRIHPITGTYEFHYGADFGAGCGVPQYAAAAGTVTYAGWYGTGGNTTTINHGMIGGSSWQTRYMHASQILVSVGQHVSQGQLIAYTGTTGGSTGCHLHFEVWKNGSTIDPLSVL